MLVWRLEREDFLGNAFQGHGSQRFPGRWNPYGFPAAYASDSRSLTVLEILVHLSPTVFEKTLRRIRYFHISAEIPDEVPIKNVTVADAIGIHREWHRTPPPDELRIFGGEWLRGLETAILKIPSVIIPREHNYVMNPRHPDFRKIKVGKPEPFVFDPRLLGK